MNKYYVTVGEYRRGEHTSYSVPLGVVVLYATCDDAAYRLAEKLYEGMSIDWPTTEEPSK